MNLIQTTLTCPDCGTHRYIWRKRNRRHGRGHIKDLYCEVCKEVTKQVDHNSDYVRGDSGGFITGVSYERVNR